MNGVTIPVLGIVTWRLKTGDFDYYRWEITDIDVNRPALYPAGHRMTVLLGGFIAGSRPHRRPNCRLRR
jgi:hypothetical protein